MTGHWSSATTGKPQLSYAERLRKAKEDAATDKAVQDGTQKTTGSETSLPADANSTASSVPPSSSVLTPVSSQANSVTDGKQDIAATKDSATRASAPEKEEALTSRSALSNVNVWEARRLQQEQKSQEEVVMPGSNGQPGSAIASIESKSQKKKKRQGAQAGDASPLQDATAWPQPNAPTQAHGAKQSPLAESSTTERSSTDSSNRKSMNLQDLDVLRVPGASDKIKKGKQWVPIVPNVTHSTPASTFHQKRQSKSAVPTQSGPEHGNVPRGPRGHSQGSRGTAGPRERSVSAVSDVSKAASTKKQFSKFHGNLSSNEASASTSDGTSSRAAESPLRRSPDLQSRLSKLSVSTEQNPRRSHWHNHPSPRGRRGRGNSKRRSMEGSDSPTDSRSRASSVSRGQTDGEPSASVAASVNGVHDDVQSRAPSSRAPSSGPPRKPRISHGNGGGRGQSGEASHQRMSLHAYGPYHPNVITQHGLAPQWSTYAQQQGYGVPAGTPMFMPIDPDRTPEELMPKGSNATQEPTRELLAQIEFYFSHHNLQGDFFLRKNMDAEGFVPIEFIAGFKRVKSISGDDCLRIVRETLPFSRVLQINADGTKVRKAMGWEAYVLDEGQRPQSVANSMPPTPHMMHASSMILGAPNLAMMTPYWAPSPQQVAAMSPSMSPQMLAPVSPALQHLSPQVASPRPSNPSLSPLHMHAETAPPSIDGAYIRSPFASPEPPLPAQAYPYIRTGHHHGQQQAGRQYGRGGNNGAHRGQRRSSTNRGGYHNVNGGINMSHWQSPQGNRRLSGASFAGALPLGMADSTPYHGASAAMSRQSSHDMVGNGNGAHHAYYYPTPVDIQQNPSLAAAYFPDPPALHDQDDDVQVLGAQAADGIAQRKQ